MATVIKIASPLIHISGVGKEGFTSGFRKMVNGEDIQLGIPQVDARWLLQGQERALLARLGSAAVPVIDDFLERGGRVGDEGVFVSKMGYVTDNAELVQLVDSALETSRILDPEHPDDDGHLLINVGAGPTAHNRRRCFEVIAGAEVRAQAANVLLEDADAANRMMGAIAVERVDVLLRLIAGEFSLDFASRLEAVSALSRFDMDAARSALAELATHNDAGFEAVLDMAAEIELVLPLADLANMAEYGDLAVRRSLSAALAIHGPAAEAVLISLVGDSDDAVAVGAARALTKVGTLAAVHPLMQRSDGILRGGDIKKAARDAIATIQLRHGGSERGGLTLADEEAGGGLAVVADGDDSPG
mgnify:CR=1 FL=1